MANPNPKPPKNSRRGNNPSGNLNTKQLLFVEEYLKDLNATQAAIRAGYSVRNAGPTGSMLLSNPKIADAIGKAKTERMEKVKVEAEDVLRELLRIAKADLRECFDSEGRLKPIAEWPEGVSAFVSSLETEEVATYDPASDGTKVIGKVRKLKMWDKVKALELLGKHLGILTERVDHTTKGEKLEANKSAQIMVFGDHKITFE